MSANAKRQKLFKQHWVEHVEGKEHVVRIYPGMNLFIGPSTAGKGNLLKAMLEISMLDKYGGPMYATVIIISMNDVSGERWKQYFLDKFGINVLLYTVGQLPIVYSNLNKRYKEKIQSINPKTGKKFKYGPSTLLIVDDFSGDNDPKAGKKMHGLLKNMPCIRSAAFDGRNSGIYTCLLAQTPTMIPPDAYDQCKFIACSQVKSSQTFDKHVFTKILCQSMKKFPFLEDWSEGMQRSWWKKQFGKMDEYEFLIRYEYRKDGKKMEEIVFFKAPNMGD